MTHLKQMGCISTDKIQMKTSKSKCKYVVLELFGKSTIIAQATTAVPVGRSRYNCTLLLDKSSSGLYENNPAKRFFWFSQLWLRKQDNGDWPEEP